MKLKLISIVFSLVVLSGCTIQTPFTVVSQWLELVRAGGSAPLAALMVDDRGQPIQAERVDVWLSEFKITCPELQSFTVKNFNRLDDPVLEVYGVEEGNMVFYSLECKDVGSVQQRVDIVKVDGVWKVSSKRY